MRTPEIKVMVDDVENGIAPVIRDECYLVTMMDWPAMYEGDDGERIVTIRDLMLAGF